MTRLAFILSLPRSGSSVLSALLDKQKGVVSAPESCFPQTFGMTPARERADSRWMAALYLASTLTPTPLSLDDAESCMSSSPQDSMIALGKALAAKLGRNPDAVRAVVWKTPRMVGMNRGPLETDGRFIVLRRHPHNVFESNFRVGFGESNRRPVRFALFMQSYENAFAQLPSERVMEVGYDDLPEAIPRILEFIGVEDSGPWENHLSSMQAAAENCYWMAEVTQEFQNRDPEKRARLDPGQVARLERAMKVAAPLRHILLPARFYYDRQSLQWVRNRARKIIETAGHTAPC